jgi:hypothetical protein
MLCLRCAAVGVAAAGSKTMGGGGTWRDGSDHAAYRLSVPALAMSRALPFVLGAAAFHERRTIEETLTGQNKIR